MIKTRKDSELTRNLLLTASYSVFCEKGYHDATIAEICAKAGTNIASVNYHFGNKKTLYKEAWIHMFKESMKIYPVDGGVAKDASPAERLRGYIRSLIYRIIKEPSDLSILHKEMANPTGLLSELITKKMRLEFEKGNEIIKALIGNNATEKQVLFCYSSILGQCFHLGASLDRKPGAIKPPEKIEDFEAYCDHVIKFSLAGICAIKEETSCYRNNEVNL
jgi:TetR/AcrR family transcriptional regulator, regulator of cefoperazone and chloramphenicol sensitivity